MQRIQFPPTTMARKGLIIRATGRILRYVACSSPVGRSHGQGRAGRRVARKGTVEYRSPARARICRESPLGGALRFARSVSPRPIRREASERSSDDGPGRPPTERRSPRSGESPRAGRALQHPSPRWLGARPRDRHPSGRRRVPAADHVPTGRRRLLGRRRRMEGRQAAGAGRSGVRGSGRRSRLEPGATPARRGRGWDDYGRLASRSVTISMSVIQAAMLGRRHSISFMAASRSVARSLVKVGSWCAIRFRTSRTIWIRS